MTPDTAQTDKTGPETSAQAVRAHGDGLCRDRAVESRTEPHGATAILRLIAHGRGCECRPRITPELEALHTHAMQEARRRQILRDGLKTSIQQLAVSTRCREDR